MDPKFKTEAGLKKWAELLLQFVRGNRPRGRPLHPTLLRSAKGVLREIEQAQAELSDAQPR